MLTTLPGTLPVTAASSKRGAAAPRPTPLVTLASRAAVLKRILPSRTAAGTGSTVGSATRSLQVSPTGQSPFTLQRWLVVRLHFPWMLATGGPRTSGTQSAPRTQGGFEPQSASCAQAAPPGWLQNPVEAGQSLFVPHRRVKSLLMQRRLSGSPEAGSIGAAAATRTTLRAR